MLLQIVLMAASQLVHAAEDAASNAASVMGPKKRSNWLIQEAEVGVEWM